MQFNAKYVSYFILYYDTVNLSIIIIVQFKPEIKNNNKNLKNSGSFFHKKIINLNDPALSHFIPFQFQFNFTFLPLLSEHCRRFVFCLICLSTILSACTCGIPIWFKSFPNTVYIKSSISQPISDDTLAKPNYVIHPRMTLKPNPV